MAHEQIHKRLTTDIVVSIIQRYRRKEITAKQAYNYLGVSKSRFYQILETYNKSESSFLLEYKRSKQSHTITTSLESHIISELQIEKEKIIDNPEVPTKHYNYSYIRNLIEEKYQEKVSVPTIIKRAKEHGYWKPKPPKKVHDREVITHYVGEIIQHDSSYHLFAPDAQQKWYLITSLDDYSRALPYAELFLSESTWVHIMALQYVCVNYGFPFSYYTDQHRIFRYVKERDKNNPWYTYTKFTDDVDTQWKQVLKDCSIQPIYALSPQAKGKIERPYQWLQDHLVRTCLRENITNIEEARKILKQEVYQYNYKRVHSTTAEVPMIRFNNALKEQKSMFRPFHIRPPFKSMKDIFCLRMKRIVDPYRTISLQGFTLKVPSVLPREEVELRLYPHMNTGVTEVRFWHNNKLVGIQYVKNTDLNIVQF